MGDPISDPWTARSLLPLSGDGSLLPGECADRRKRRFKPFLARPRQQGWSSKQRQQAARSPRASPFAILGLLLATLTFAAGEEYNHVKDLPYRDGGDEYSQERCKLDVYHPADKKDFATVVWFHGGGLRNGKKSIPKELKEQGVAVVAVNYRLFPKVKCPTYIEDAAASVAWTFDHIAKYGGDRSKIFVSGHSAGGYLTSMVGLDKSYLDAHGIDADKIAGLIPFSGHTITHFTPREERGIKGEQPIIDEFAPLYHVRKDAPPLVLVTGDRELEMLGRYEENAYLWRMMKVAGHEGTELFELDGFNHGGMAKPAFGLLLQHIRAASKH